MSTQLLRTDPKEIFIEAKGAFPQGRAHASRAKRGVAPSMVRARSCAPLAGTGEAPGRTGRAGNEWAQCRVACTSS